MAYPGGDDIRIAPGTYSGPVTLDNAADDGNLIDGVGSPTLLNPSGTIINYANNVPAAAFVIPAGRTNIKVPDLLVQAQTAANDPRGFEIEGDRITIEDVGVDMEDDASTQAAIFFAEQAEAGVLTRVRTSGIWDGAGLHSRRAPARLPARPPCSSTEVPPPYVAAGCWPLRPAPRRWRA